VYLLNCFKTAKPAARKCVASIRLPVLSRPTFNRNPAVYFLHSVSERKLSNVTLQRGRGTGIQFLCLAFLLFPYQLCNSEHFPAVCREQIEVTKKLTAIRHIHWPLWKKPSSFKHQERGFRFMNKLVLYLVAGIVQWFSAGLRVGWSRVRVLLGAENFSLHHLVQTGSGAHRSSYPMGTRRSSPGVKRLGRKADNSPPSSAEVKEWVELYFHSPSTP
jgi:hypothetical protein